MHEPSNAVWVQKSNNTGKMPDRPVYAKSNSSSRDSEHDILGFHSGLFGNIDDAPILSRDLSHVSVSAKDRTSSNAIRHSVPRTVDGNISLIDIDQINASDSEENYPDEDKMSQEIEELNKRVHHLISLRAQKEANKEKEVKDKIMERDRLLRQIADLEVLAKEKEKGDEEGLVIREILIPKIRPASKSVAQPSKEVSNDSQLPKVSLDKGKQIWVDDEVESKTAEGISHRILAHEREMERMRKEKEDLQMELEKVELEAANQEVKRKINYLKAPPITFPSEDLSKPNPQHISFPQVNTQPAVHTNIASASQIPSNKQYTQTSQSPIPKAKMIMGNNSTVSPFQRRPINLEQYRQLFFDGIPGYPNHVPTELRDKLHKFSENNAVSAEEHIISFGDLINDYEIADEDVIMKLFVQSLVDDARDWYRGLPVASIG